MKAMFGVVSLLVVLAVVGWVTTHQLHAVGRDLTATGSPNGQGAPVSASASPAVPTASAVTLSQQVDSLQRKARADTARALQQGMERNERAERAEQGGNR